MPAVRTKVIPTDNALSGGCKAAEAISHAEDAINKISLNAAQIFAKIAGRKFLKLMKSPSEPKISCAEKISCQSSYNYRRN